MLAEVPVTAYHADEILHADELPKYYVGLSSCYRREAGTYGKDTRGLYRIHQFQKVEQVVLCVNDPEVSAREHEHILQNAGGDPARPCTCPIVWSWCVEAIWGSRK